MISREFTSGNVTTVYDGGQPGVSDGSRRARRAKAGCVRCEPVSGPLGHGSGEEQIHGSPRLSGYPDRRPLPAHFIVAGVDPRRMMLRSRDALLRRCGAVSSALRRVLGPRPGWVVRDFS